MLNFVRKAFRNGFEVILWINLIVWAIAGGIVGNALGGYYDSYAFLGVIIGIIVGLLINIIGGGLIATILSIDENIKQLRNKITGEAPSKEENGFSGGAKNSVMYDVSQLLKQKIIRWAASNETQKERNAFSAETNNPVMDVSQLGNKIYDVITEAAIKNMPEHNAKIINTLAVGYKVYVQNEHKNKEENSIWYYIKTPDCGEGWCNSAHLKQC